MARKRASAPQKPLNFSVVPLSEIKVRRRKSRKGSATAKPAPFLLPDPGNESLIAYGPMGCAGNMQSPQLDRFARDARAWKHCAEINYVASGHLFASGNLFVCFGAATLGHHALEMYLKAALICEGMTVFNPVILKSLDGTVRLTRAECAWGHCLVDLAMQLSEKRPDFNLRTEMNLAECRTLLMPMTLEGGFALFDPFFTELRYPQDLKKYAVSQDYKIVLDVLVARLQPFVNKQGRSPA